MSLRDRFTRTTETGSTSPQTPHGIGRKFMAAERELWAVAIGAMCLDIVLTVYGLNLGLREQNPVARGALDTVGVAGLFGLKAAAVAVGVCCLRFVPNQYRVVVPLGLAVPSLVAVGINTALITWILL